MAGPDDSAGANVVLEHTKGDCTGDWRLLGRSQERIIQCDACSAHYPAAPEYRLAAIDENYAGIYLRRLAVEGADLLPGHHRDP
jgi:hypothetical protein